jgi:hypothetical protein
VTKKEKDYRKYMSGPGKKITMKTIVCCRCFHRGRKLVCSKCGHHICLGCKEPD